MTPQNTVSLLCEPCPICKKPISLLVDEKVLQPAVNGLTTVIDAHGLFLEHPHARILHVDRQSCVRAWQVVFAITIHKENLAENFNVDSKQEEIKSLQKQVLELKNQNSHLQKVNAVLINKNNQVDIDEIEKDLLMKQT
ncbi:MAG: hypothetical protein ACFFCQ_00580 [Promethearchaeota archaeon]